MRAMKTVIYFYESAFLMWRRRLAGIYAVARREGWHVEAVDVGELDGGAESVFSYWKPVGAIVEGGVFRHRGCDPSAFANAVTVYCDADTAKIGTSYFGVRQKPEEVVVRAVNELLSRDFQNYAFVHYRTMRDWTMERESVFIREMKSRGKTTHVFQSWRTKRNDGGPALGAELEDFVISLPRPCGILAANDEMAVHVLGAARKAGISVPEEMTVMGIDNDELVCENTRPTLSSVAPAFMRSGKLAAGLLARRLKHPGTRPTVVGFGADPIERRLSTGKCSRTDFRVAKALEYIRTNACKGISAGNAVCEMGLSARTAENRFRAAVGHSIRDEIIAVRISKAKQLLANPDIAVNSIYAYCGYRNERSLRWVFTKATGFSPAAWRAHSAARGNTERGPTASIGRL